MHTPQPHMNSFQNPAQRDNPLPLDAVLPNNVKFSQARKIKDRLSIIVSGLTVVGAGLLAGSSIPYTISNISKGDDRGTGPATTLLTHIAGLEKYDENLGGTYPGDPDDYMISTITRDGQVVDSIFDKFLGTPGNFSILIGGLLIMGFGLAIMSENLSKTLRERMKESLEKGESLTFIKGQKSMIIRLHINSSGLQQITLTTKEKTTHISYNNANVEAIITKIIDRYAQRHLLEDIVPNSGK